MRMKHIAEAMGVTTNAIICRSNAEKWITPGRKKKIEEETGEQVEHDEETFELSLTTDDVHEKSLMVRLQGALKEMGRNGYSAVQQLAEQDIEEYIAEVHKGNENALRLELANLILEGDEAKMDAFIDKAQRMVNFQVIDALLSKVREIRGASITRATDVVHLIKTLRESLGLQGGGDKPKGGTVNVNVLSGGAVIDASE